MSLVTIGASAEPNYNIPNAGPDRTFNVTVVNSSTAISSAALFPAQAVGYGGFTITLGGVEYVVAYVTSTSAAVLASPYLSIGATVSCFWPRWLWMQIYSTKSFQPFGALYMVGEGAPGSSAIYKKYACSLINSAGVWYLRHPQVTIDATTNGSPTNQARYFFGLYRVDGGYVQAFPGLDAARVPTTTPTNLEMLVLYNHPPDWPPFPEQYYTENQIDQRFPSGNQGQILVYPAVGNILQAFTLGSGFTIDYINRIVNGGGGGNPPVRTITTSDALLSTDGVILINAAGGPVTLVFPPGASLGVKLFYVIKIDSSANAGTLDPNGAELINGAATFALSRQYAAAIVYCTGSAFYVLGGNLLSAIGSVRTVTGATSITSADGTLLCNATSAGFTVSLPAAASLPGLTVTIKKIDATVNLVTIDPSGSETIDGYVTWILSMSNQDVTIQSDGAAWRMIS